MQIVVTLDDNNADNRFRLVSAKFDKGETKTSLSSLMAEGGFTGGYINGCDSFEVLKFIRPKEKPMICVHTWNCQYVCS